MIADCKERMPLPVLWAALGLAEADRVRSGVNVRSPFREDKTASLWIKQRPSGWFWEDKGSGGQLKGDEVDLIMAARDCDGKEAIRIYHELAGVTAPENAGRRPRRRARRQGDKGTGRRESPQPQQETQQDEVEFTGPVPAGYEATKVYSYTDLFHATLHQTIRFEDGSGERPKTFRQRRPAKPGDENEMGGWVYSLKEIELVPYRWPYFAEVGPETPIFFVEGEKDADTIAERLELVSTTVAMGAGKWRENYGSLFAGKWVVLVADDDEAGEQGVEAIAKGLVPFVERLGILRMGDLNWPGDRPKKADVTDWVNSLPDVPVEELAEELSQVASQCECPPEIWFEGIAQVGNGGGVQLLEDVLSRRLVTWRRLCWIGSNFWRWEEEGIWKQMLCPEEMDALIRKVMRRDPLLLPLITAHRVASVGKLCTSVRFHHPNQLNQHDGMLLNCRSGMLNALTGEVLPHDRTLMSTTQVPLEWDPDAECPQWHTWLEDMQPDEAVRLQLQEIFGYCLVPAVSYHKFFFFYGDGGTGKSTCVDILEALVGEDNTMALQLEELQNGFMRETLVGKQLYIAGELTKHSFKHIGLIKQISANEPIAVDVKHGKGYKYRPKGRFVMTSNVVAHTPDTTEGFGRRFLQIDWKKQIEKEDAGLLPRLKEELPGIFQWAIEGFQRLYERGGFEHTEASLAAKTELMRHRASVKEFLHDPEWIVDNGPGGDGKPTLRDLFDHYKEWCDFHGVNAYYQEVDSFSKEAYRRWPELKDRRKREWRDHERITVVPGVQMSAPAGWEG